MSFDATLATEMLAPCLRALAQLGPEIETRAVESGLAILEQEGLRIGSFRDLTTRIPHRVGLRLLDNAVETSGDPAFALHAGDGVERGEFGLFDLLSRSAPTLGESIAISTGYLPLLHDGAFVEVIEKGRKVLWCHRLREGLQQSSSANDYVVAAYFKAAKDALGVDAAPEGIWFAHRRPRYADEYGEVFRAPVRFGRECNAVVMPRAALALPLVSADRALHALLKRYADVELKQVNRFSPFSQRVRSLVGDELERGAPLARVARAMHMSASTLGRRLAAGGSSYSKIVDDVRRELASELLCDSGLNISEVAFRLGFSHRPAFHRAFKRWHGMAPREYRERNVRSTFYRFYRR